MTRPNILFLHTDQQRWDALERNGLAENTIIVFTSDHGEWLGDHGRFGKSYPAHDRVSRMPLLISAPQTGVTVSAALVEAVDLLPTPLDLAGGQTSPQVNGKSLVPCLAGETMHRYAVHADGSETLFDLQEPHGEYRDLAAEPAHAPVLHEMRRAMILRSLEMERPRARLWTY
jgi:arylsulfatase A-like enzyme